MTQLAAAFFDVDGTILEGNVVRYFVNLRTWEMTPWKRRLWMTAFALKVPFYIALDAYSRHLFSCVFYRNYSHLKPSQLERLAPPHFEERMKPRIYPASLERIKEHQGRNEAVVLVTNSLEPLVEPLVRQIGAAGLLGARLVVEGARFTGRLEGGPLTDRRKADALTSFAQKNSLDLSRCYAYADSMDDLPMLEAAGNPIVVNPQPRLKKIAGQRGWPVMAWKPASNQASSR